MTHRECRKLFVEALYDEWTNPQKEAFGQHLSGCDECRSAFNAMRMAAAAMDRRSRPEMTEVEWTIFWNELSTELQRKGKERKTRVFPWERLSAFLRFRPALGYAGAALGILAAGVLIGRLAFTGSAELDTQLLSSQLNTAEKSILNERAQKYLQRSKILLLGIVNGSIATPGSYDLSKQQEVSRMLVSEAADLRSELTDADQQRMRKLVTDLEVLLLQIANLEQAKDFPALEIVKDGVERNGILLKINLEQMNAPAPPPAESKRVDPSESSI